jgi:hypothetical protein
VPDDGLSNNQFINPRNCRKEMTVRGVSRRPVVGMNSSDTAEFLLLIRSHDWW